MVTETVKRHDVQAVYGKKERTVPPVFLKSHPGKFKMKRVIRIMGGCVVHSPKKCADHPAPHLSSGFFGKGESKYLLRVIYLAEKLQESGGQKMGFSGTGRGFHMAAL